MRGYGLRGLSGERYSAVWPVVTMVTGVPTMLRRTLVASRIEITLRHAAENCLTSAVRIHGEAQGTAHKCLTFPRLMSTSAA